MATNRDLLLGLVGLGLVVGFGGAIPSGGTSLPLGIGISTLAGLALMASIFLL